MSIVATFKVRLNMTYQEAEKVIFRNSIDKSLSARDDLYASEKGRLQNLITSAPESLKTAYEQSLEQLETAYEILLQGPAGISLEPPARNKDITTTEKKSIDESDDESDHNKENRQKPSFLKALMSHWGVFFLAVGCFSMALLMTILWSGQKSELSTLESVNAQNESYKELLTNKPLNLVNLGDDPYKLLGYTVYYYDEKENKIKKYLRESMDTDIILKPNTTGIGSSILLTDLASDKRTVAFDGNALFFSMVLLNTRTGAAQSWTDYVGDHNNPKGNINLDLNN